MNLVAHHIDSTQAAEAIFIEIYNLAGFMSIERERERERERVRMRVRDRETETKTHARTQKHTHR